jgi:hypothetical protein
MAGMVPDFIIVFKLNEERKELNYRKLNFAAWSELKAQLGFTPLTLMSAAQTYDLEAFGAIMWLERRQRERTLRWPEVRRDLERVDVDFELIDFIVDGVSQSGEDDEPEEEPDPTTPADS